jgi:hypothetical protein
VSVWTPELWALVGAAALAAALRCPWWSEGRARSHLLGARHAWRGRHRFALPPVGAGRLLVGRPRAFGRLCSAAPDEHGRGGWVGYLDWRGRVHVDRWLAPPLDAPREAQRTETTASPSLFSSSRA